MSTIRKRYKILIVIAIVLILVKFTTYLFHIKHDKNDVYEIKNWIFKDTIHVKNGYAVIGHNIMGDIEATVFPVDPVQIILNEHLKDTIDYIYLRFHPAWFKDSLNPFLISLDKEKPYVYDSGVQIHKKHLKNFYHFYEIPIVPKGVTPSIIVLKNRKIAVNMNYISTRNR